MLLLSQLQLHGANKMNDITKETLRVLKQFHNIKEGFVSKVTPEELWERRQEYMRENSFEREESDREHHTTYLGEP